MEPTEKFKPTTAWMAEKYTEMNEWLFNGKLGGCDFDVFTIGKGSQGETLGIFSLDTSCGIKVERLTRRMFKLPWNGYGKIYINDDNFVEQCNPKISLNGNYTATEEGWLNTLVHEMCHYYCYMNGLCPKQGHGPEFKRIAAAVSYRSNGLFTIERLASAEEMKNFELDSEVVERNKKRTENRKMRTVAVLVFKTNGYINLTLTTRQSVIDEIVDYWTNRHKAEAERILLSKDLNLIDTVISKGFRSLSNKHRFWSATDLKHFGIENMSDYNYETIYPRNIAESLTGKGTFMSIIENTIDNHMKEMFGDDIEITPNMNLGIASPFEFAD